MGLAAGFRKKYSMTAMTSTGSKTFAVEMEAAYEYVDKHFRIEEIYGESGADVLERLAARASHHVMPFGLAVQCALCACTNGALVAAFPGKPSPVSLLLLNINRVQTRKSQLNSVLSAVAEVVDKSVVRKAKAAVLESGGTPQPVKTKSISMQKFTEAAFFQRCSSDFAHVESPEEVRGRYHYSTLLELDECYAFLRMVGLAGTARSGGEPSSHAACQSDAGSELNRVLQTGVSLQACKTVGSFGDRTMKVNLCGVGNAHPTKFVNVLKGECSSGNLVATLERLLLTTGRCSDQNKVHCSEHHIFRE